MCWDVRDFDPELSRSANRDLLILKCSACVLVFSHHYEMLKSEWNYYESWVNTYPKKNKTTLKGLLDTKKLLCVLLSECNIPLAFSDQFMLDWSDIDLRTSFWN